MDDIYMYYMDAPIEVKEMVAPCIDGYTVYINARLSEEAQRRAFKHAIRHIKNNDFDGINTVNEIESTAHYEWGD